MKWLIWSNEHDQWWAPHHLGYVRSREMAGRYSFEEARDIVIDANRKLQGNTPDETMCPDWTGARDGGAK